MTDNTNLSIFHNGCLREILRIAMIKKTNKLGVTWSNWIQQCANHSKLREDFGYRVRRIETCQWNDPSHNSDKPQKEHKTHGPHHSTEALHFPQVQLKSLLPYNPRKPGIMVWTDMNLYHMKMLVSKSKKLYHLVLEKISNEFSYITISNLRSLCGHCCKQIWSYTTWGYLYIDLINATLVVLEKVGWWFLFYFQSRIFHCYQVVTSWGWSTTNHASMLSAQGHCREGFWTVSTSVVIQNLFFYGHFWKIRDFHF